MLSYGPTSPSASKGLNFPVVRVIGWSYTKASPRGRSWARSPLYNYADDNTIAVICDTKQYAIDALSQ